MQEPILTCDGLCKSYLSPVIENMNLSLPCGKIIGLLGPNGSGKTTLLKLAAGLLQPTGGKILIGGRAPCPESKAIVSYLPERNSLPEYMTARQLLDFFDDMFPGFDQARAEEMLLDLKVDMNKRIRHLSKGNKEKVQLIMVMCRRARLYLLDEPIGGVDPATRDYILETILGGHSPDSTILISTHLIADVEKVLDDFLFLREGKIVAGGDVKEYCEKEGCTLDEAFRRIFKC